MAKIHIANLIELIRMGKESREGSAFNTGLKDTLQQLKDGEDIHIDWGKFDKTDIYDVLHR